jgi:dihydrofolate reductase
METKKKQASKIKYSAFVVCSIDGRISENSKSGTNWASKEDWKHFQKSLSKMDAVLTGHNTYTVAETSLKKRNTIVLTSKVSTPTSAGSVVFFNPEKHNIKKFLQSKNYKHIGVIGGSQVYDFCLKNKMIDEIFVTIEPDIFTAGVPMFSGNKFSKYPFILHSVKKLNKKGSLLLQYTNEN